MKSTTFLGRAAAVLLGIASASASATLVYNSDLAVAWNPPGNNGQSNGAFVIANQLGNAPIELGLRAQQRRDGPVTPDPADSYFYTVRAGADDDNTPVALNRAWWNFDFSATYGSATSNVGLADLDSLKLRIYDQGSLINTIDLLAVAASRTNPNTVQDSWNPLFGVVGVPGFTTSMTSFAYWFTLVATDSGTSAGTLMCVHTDQTSCGVPPPLPEPATLAIVGLGLAGLAVTRRRKTA